MNPLRRLAAGTAVPVFAAMGGGARPAVDRLRADPGLEFVASPRHATVLLAAGCFPQPLLDPLRRVHDAIPHPRAAIWWTGASDPRLAEYLGGAVVVDGDAEACSDALRTVHRAVMAGARPSLPDLLPDEPPIPWEGVGPFGQGGEGMMGGTPYGRPMAMTGPDRDGVALDRLELSIGPFNPALPPGLVLEVVLQGGVIQELAPVASPFAVHRPAPAGTALVPDDRAPLALSRGPASLAAGETARAAHHLRVLAHGLDLHGLTALARRAYWLAAHLSPREVGAVSRLGRRALRGLRPATSGAGRLPVEFAAAPSGAGDAYARWRQRVAKAQAALRLAGSAFDRTSTTPGPEAAGHGDESGGLDQRELVRRLPEVLVGRDWHDAMTTVASLDLDLQGAAGLDAAVAP